MSYLKGGAHLGGENDEFIFQFQERPGRLLRRIRYFLNSPAHLAPHREFLSREPPRPGENVMVWFSSKNDAFLFRVSTSLTALWSNKSHGVRTIDATSLVLVTIYRTSTCSF